MTVERVGAVPSIKPDLGGVAGGRTEKLAPRKERIYTAGPMTGYPSFNIPAFDEAAAKLRAQGYHVTSPAELDDPATRKAALASPDGAPGSGSANGQTWEDFLRRDLDIVRNIDGIAALPGWDQSKGATFEVDTANKLDCWVRPYDPETGELGEPFARDALARICARKWLSVFGVDYEQVKKTVQLVEKLAENASGEKRVVDAKTGGAKGQKDAWLSLIPPSFKYWLSRVYKMGAEKYSRDNYLRGYNWSLSLDAMQRHIDAVLNGQWEDEESGLPHLAHAAWHCATLIVYKENGLGTDDRVDFTGKNFLEEQC
jgi:hypothetical protein